MTRDTAGNDRRLPRHQRGAFALVAVVCIIFAGATVVMAQQSIDTSDDFEDGNIDGWATESNTEFSSTSIEGSGSYHIQSSDGPGVGFGVWEDGPELSLSEGFEVTGTVRANSVNPDLGETRVGVYNNESNGGALLAFSYDDGRTYLLSESLGDRSEESINNDFHDEWVEFEIWSEDGSSQLNAKVWEYGTAEPSSAQITRDFSGVSGKIAVSTGGGIPDRNLWLDSVSVTGEEYVPPNASEDLRLDVPRYLPHNESSHYAVEANQSGTWTDVTGQANVTPDDTDALTFYPSNQTVVAGNNTSINKRVGVVAEYGGLNQSGSIVVATPTVDNLDLLPAWWSVNATLSDWTMIWILMATLIATAASRMATTFAGIGGFVLAMVMGWIMGDVPDGIMVATILMGIFIGLNLAANIDYSVR